MNDETNKKQEWQTPEIIDLDVKNTKGGPSPWTHEDVIYHPTS